MADELPRGPRARLQHDIVEAVTPLLPREERPYIAEVLERISDSVAREIYRRKVQLRIDGSTFCDDVGPLDYSVLDALLSGGWDEE